MNIIIVIIISIVLFGLFFLSKRRFGMQGLALVAGATLAGLWGKDLSTLIASAGIVPAGIPVAPLVICLITVIPAIALLIRGKKTKKIGHRLFGSTLFVLLALALIVEPLGSILPLDASGVVVYTLLFQYQSVIIGVSIVIAVVDILMSKAPKPVPEEKHRH